MNFTEEERLICMALDEDPEKIEYHINYNCTIYTNAPMALMVMEASGFAKAVKRLNRLYAPELAEALRECKRHDGKDDEEYMYNAGLRDAFSKVLGITGRPNEAEEA